MARLYPTLLGARREELAPLLRTVHESATLLRGTVTVTRGESKLAGLLANLAGMPRPCAEAPCEVRFASPSGTLAGAERWERDMAGYRFSSLLLPAAPAEFAESFGWYRFRFGVELDNGAAEFVLRGWSVLGLPLPRFSWPRIVTRESQEDDEYLFMVRVRLPLIGHFIGYNGRLRVVQ